MYPPLLLLVPLLASAPLSLHEGDGWRLVFAPEGRAYEEYVADPRRPVFSLTNVNAYDSDLDDAGNSRNGVRMGARFALARYEPRDGGPGVQLDGHVGFLGEFDRDNSTDNLGWDGLFGFDLTYRPSERLGLQLGYAHDSSHLGDEYVLRTGRERIDYTREEWNLGTRVTLDGGFDAYAEFGYATTLRNDDLLEPGRAQAGLEWEGAPSLFGDRFGPFAALDVGAFEEDDWDPNFNLQSGLVRRAGNGSIWRFGLEFYDGRSTIGELFLEDQQHVALGVWLDP